MTTKEKEFEVQRALGLAEGYILIIQSTSIEPQVSVQKIEEAVEKHTFVSKCIATKVDYPYAKYTTTGYGVEYINAGPGKIILTFSVKCIHKVKSLIITELQPYEINIELRICPGLFDMKPIPIRQNFTDES